VVLVRKTESRIACCRNDDRNERKIHGTSCNSLKTGVIFPLTQTLRCAICISHIAI